MVQPYRCWMGQNHRSKPFDPVGQSTRLTGLDCMHDETGPSAWTTEVIWRGRVNIDGQILPAAAWYLGGSFCLFCLCSLLPSVEMDKRKPIHARKRVMHRYLGIHGFVHGHQLMYPGCQVLQYLHGWWYMPCWCYYRALLPTEVTHWVTAIHSFPASSSEERHRGVETSQ